METPLPPLGLLGSGETAKTNLPLVLHLDFHWCLLRVERGNPQRGGEPVPPAAPLSQLPGRGVS